MHCMRQQLGDIAAGVFCKFGGHGSRRFLGCESVRELTPCMCDKPLFEEVSAARAQSLGLRAQLEAMILLRSSAEVDGSAVNWFHSGL